ncbi:MAG: hypothetical protein HN769_14365 [Anaerolineae bacterium]|jgi:hypothetical protein|nr:hypothetical protein [Anaerolineae bacterium]
MKLSKVARAIFWLSFVMIAIAMFAVPVLASPVLPASPVVDAAPEAEITPEQLADILLVTLGSVLSLAFKYVPKWKTWFDGFSHQGLLMLGLIVVTGGAMLALSCTPYAAQLGIVLACGETSFFVLIRAVFIIGAGNQMTYLLSPKPKE